VVARLTPRPRRHCGTGTFTGAPRPLTPSERQYSDRKLRSSTERALRHQPENSRQVADTHESGGPTDGTEVPRSTVLSTAEETLIVTIRRHTLLPLDDCLYALQATIPHLTRSSLHRLFQRHGISRLPSVEGPPPRPQFRAHPLGFVHIDLAEVWTEEGKLYMFVAIDRVSKFAFAELHERATRRVAATR
jgi:hypothetical protein